VAIIGYPKCGNTWYSALLRHLLMERYGLPRERLRTLFVSDLGRWPLLCLPREVPRLYHSHCLPFPREIGLRGVREWLESFADTPMIILIRDCKDVLVSYFMHEVYRAARPRFSGSVAEFVRSPVFGVEKFVDYYNLLAEIRRAAQAPTAIVRYKDYWFDPIRSLERNARWIGIDGVTRQQLERVVAQCSLEPMRRMEREATQETAMIPGLFRSHNDRPEAYKVRKGGVGNWCDHLSADVAASIDRYVEDHLDAFYVESSALTTGSRAASMAVGRSVGRKARTGIDRVS
jgi:hypothetical protein